jgi:WD40 repeat protein
MKIFENINILGIILKTLKLYNRYILRCIKNQKLLEILIKSLIQTKRIIKGHKNGITALVLNTDNHLLTGSYDSTIKVWNTSTFKCIKILKGHTSFITALSTVKPDGNFISASNDLTIRIWSDYNCIKIVKAASTPSNSILTISYYEVLLCITCRAIGLSLSTYEIDNGWFHGSTINRVIHLEDNKLASASWDTT